MFGLDKLSLNKLSAPKEVNVHKEISAMGKNQTAKPKSGWHMAYVDGSDPSHSSVPLVEYSSRRTVQ